MIGTPFSGDVCIKCECQPCQCNDICCVNDIQGDVVYTIVCMHPLEIEFPDGSIATGQAARYIIDRDSFG